MTRDGVEPNCSKKEDLRYNHENGWSQTKLSTSIKSSGGRWSPIASERVSRFDKALSTNTLGLWVFHQLNTLGLWWVFYPQTHWVFGEYSINWIHLVDKTTCPWRFSFGPFFFKSWHVLQPSSLTISVNKCLLAWCALPGLKTKRAFNSWAEKAGQQKYNTPPIPFNSSPTYSTGPPNTVFNRWLSCARSNENKLVWLNNKESIQQLSRESWSTKVQGWTSPGKVFLLPLNFYEKGQNQTI